MKTIIILLIAALCINASIAEHNKPSFANQPAFNQPPTKTEILEDEPQNLPTPQIAQDLPYHPEENEHNHNHENRDKNNNHEGRHERNHEGRHGDHEKRHGEHEGKHGDHEGRHGDHGKHGEGRHHGKHGHHGRREGEEGHMRGHGDRQEHHRSSNFNEGGYQNNFRQHQGGRHRRHMPKGAKIAIIATISVIGLLALCCLVKCCKRRKQLRRERKQRREAMRQQQLQTQQYLNNSNNLGQGFLQFQTQPNIAVGQPINVAPQMMNYQYPQQANSPVQQQLRVNQQVPQQPYYQLPNQHIAQGQPIYVPQQFRQQHPVVANNQGYMQVELPQLQVNNNDTNRSIDADAENSRRYPVLNQQQNAPYNAQGYQQF